MSKKNKKKGQKRNKEKRKKNFEMWIRRELILISFPLIVVIMLLFIRSCLFTICENTHHIDNCCPLAYYCPINKIEDEIACVEDYTKGVFYEVRK